MKITLALLFLMIIPLESQGDNEKQDLKIGRVEFLGLGYFQEVPEAPEDLSNDSLLVTGDNEKQDLKIR